MRVATMVVSLVLTLGLGVQSCAVTAGGGIISGLGSTRSEVDRGDSLASGGAIGLLTALVWVLGAAFVLGKPRVSMWLFAASVPLCLLGAAVGYSDLFLWSIAGVLFALGSWRGIAEQERDAEQRQAAMVTAAAAAQQQLAPPGWHPDPWGNARLRYYDGRAWTSHVAD